MTISPGGVDLATGRFVYDEQDLQIGGEGPGSLELRKTTNDEAHPRAIPGASFDINWNITLKQFRSCDICTTVSDVTVSNRGTAYTFFDGANPASGALNLTSNGAFGKLTRTMVGTSQNFYTLTTADGSIIQFTVIPIPGPVSGSATAYATSLTAPNGVVLSLAYSNNVLQSVTSNAGYKLLFEFANGLRSKACIINLSYQPDAVSCPLGAQSITYGYIGTRLNSVTDRVGNVWQYVITPGANNASFTEKLYRPNEGIPYVTNTWSKPQGETFVVTSQDFVDGRHIDYSYTAETFSRTGPTNEPVDHDLNLGTGWKVNNIQETLVTFGTNGALPPIITPTPISVIDPLNRTYTWSYPPVSQWSGGAVVQGRTLPEGNGETYTYDAYRNRTAVTQVRKPGTSGPAIATSAVFGNCSATTLLACDQPTATVDANGKHTDYSYSPVHGGLLTETAPADTNGNRPQNRYTYAQRYAWIKNGSGYVRASSPIWLRVEERFCKSTATVGNACAGGSTDEVVTSYDYGPDTGPNNLWLRGVVVAAAEGTHRTCFGYDQNGRKISETSPNAMLSFCP